MYELMHKNDNQYLRCRDGVYYFVRRVPNDLKDIYTSDRISMSLKTKLITTARRVAKSIDQRLEDYWMGIRLQKIDIPAIQLVQPDRLSNDKSPTLSEAVELLEELQPKKAYLTHISHLLGKHEAVQKELPDFIQIAHDNLTFEL